MYLRKFSLQVGTNGSGLELSPDPKTQPRCVFKTFQNTVETPNHVTIRVYNVSDDTANTIQKEFTQVSLQAGYVDSDFGMIFNGTIIQVKKGYEGMGGIDSYIDILAADGDASYIGIIVSTTVKAGSSFQDRYNALVQAGMVAPPGDTSGSQGLTQGQTAQLPSGQLPRGRVYYGMWRDHMRDFSKSTDTMWSIQNGQITLMPLNLQQTTGQAVVLTSATGLIGYPEQTESGIKIRSLLNPNLRPGGQVTIQNSAVQQAALNPSYAGAKQNSFLPSLSADGTYNIIVVEHSGDTRGNSWYTDLICLAPGSIIPPSLAQYPSLAGYISKGYTGVY